MEDLKLEIDEANLGAELAKHAAQFAWAGEQAVRATLAHDEFKLKVEELRAIVDRNVRVAAEAEKRKITEKMVENEVLINEDVMKAAKHLLALKANAEILKARKEAWNQRGSMLTQMSANRRQEMESIAFDSVRERAAA